MLNRYMKERGASQDTVEFGFTLDISKLENPTGRWRSRSACCAIAAGTMEYQERKSSRSSSNWGRELETRNLSTQDIPGFNGAMSGNKFQVGPSVDGIEGPFSGSGIISDLKCPSERSLHSKRCKRPGSTDGNPSSTKTNRSGQSKYYQSQRQPKR